MPLVEVRQRILCKVRQCKVRQSGGCLDFGPRAGVASPPARRRGPPGIPPQRPSVGRERLAPMADRQTIRGSSAANPEFRGSVRAEDGSQVFVYNGGLDLEQTGEFVVSRGVNVVLEVIDAGAMPAPDHPASSEALGGHSAAPAPLP